MTLSQSLVLKIETMPANRQAEVLDFIEFLASREEMQSLSRAAAATNGPSFAAVWDNDADSIYDEL